MNIPTMDDQAVEVISNSILKAVKNVMNKLPYDVTKRGFVTDILDNNMYKVKMQGTVYSVPSLNNQTFNVGDTVYIKFPQNNTADAHICGNIGKQ